MVFIDFLCLILYLSIIFAWYLAIKSCITVTLYTSRTDFHYSSALTRTFPAWTPGKEKCQKNE